MENIILIGMPGCGKSTVGVLCAKTLGMPFVDTDLLLQQEHGTLLQDMVNTMGQDTFLREEERIICAQNISGTVIATGGSVALEANAMRHLRKNSNIVYLHLSFAEVERRLYNISNRGIAMKKGETLHAIYEYRMPFYQQYADYTVHADGQTLEQTVENVVRLFWK